MATEPLLLILCDQQHDLIQEWRRHFGRYPDVEIRLGDMMDVDADAYVSPANSHGWMDGGLDLELRERFMAGDIETKVQSAIARHGGPLPVGQALVVETDDVDVPYLVVAPTMEVPSYVGMTSNAFKAMSALLHAVLRFNDSGEEVIESVVVPGLGTGVGGMEPRVAALQMHQAYVNWLAQDR